MQWWAWIAVGAILLGSELAFVDAQFYLVFIGAAALLVGLLDLAGLHARRLAAVAAVCASWPRSSMVAFRRRIYERMRRNLPAVKPGPAGETVMLPAALPPGETCRLEYSRQFLERGQRRNRPSRPARARASSGSMA